MSSRRRYSNATYGPYKKYRKTNGYISRGSRGFVRTSGYYRRRGGVLDYPEKKFRDSGQLNIAVVNTGTLAVPSINLVPIGSNQNEMIGRKIVIKRINIRMKVDLDGKDTVASSEIGEGVMRILLVQDKQCNGTGLSNTTDLLTTANIYSYMNLENSKRFKILKEWTEPMSSPIGSESGTFFYGSNVHWINWSKKCNITIDYSAQAGGSRVIGEVKSNNIFLFAISDSSNTMKVSVLARIRYTDD